MLGVKDAFEVLEEELAMVEDVAELGIGESNPAAKFRLLESEGANGISLGCVFENAPGLCH